jgi:SAM-dependent methyltransferase
MLAYLPDVDYLGVDISAKYIEAAKARYGARGRFVCRDLAQVAADEPHAFDAVLLLGVLHHLDDATALHALEVARDALKPGGRMVAIDATVFGGQSRIAKVLAKMDRGRHVRSPDGYVELARRVFPTVDSFMTHDLLRIPYTHHFLVCAPKRDVRSAA